MGFLDALLGPDINERVAEARRDPEAVLLDVRSRSEFELGHIEGAVNIPLEQVEKAAELYAGKHLYVYCLSGSRSGRAVAVLKAAGVEFAENIGGVPRWRGPMERR